MAKELERTNVQLKVTLDDYSKVVVINSAIRNKLTKEKMKCQKEEEALKVSSPIYWQKTALDILVC